MTFQNYSLETMGFNAHWTDMKNQFFPEYSLNASVIPVQASVSIRYISTSFFKKNLFFKRNTS